MDNNLIEFKDTIEEEDPVEIDYESRSIYLRGEINEGTLDATIAIMNWNKDDRDIETSNRKPIYLYLDSFGGIADYAFGLVEMIKLSKTPVYTIALGKAQSSAAIILVMSQKGRRFVMRNSNILMHDGEMSVRQTLAKFNSTIDFHLNTIENRDKEIAELIGMPYKKFKQKLAEEWFMTGEEAVNAGFADKVITDIDMLY